MTLVQEYPEPNQFRQWTGQPLTVLVTGEEINAPLAIEDRWSDEKLAEVGLYRPVPFVPPGGKVTTGEPTYERVGNQIIETYAVTNPPPKPPPTPEEIREGTFAADPGVQGLAGRLSNATPAEIDAWLLANITNMAQARDVLGHVIKAIVLLRKGKL